MKQLALLLSVVLICSCANPAPAPSTGQGLKEPPPGFARGLISAPQTRLPGGEAATLQQPVMLRAGGGTVRPPRWTTEGLWPRVPQDLYGLAAVEKPGAPAWDPSTRAWYASANGTLVRVMPDRSLPVVADNVQGNDIDVRLAKGVLVSREPDLNISLWRLGDGGGQKKVLLKGSRFFGPRLSPDGTQVLVSESRAQGGHVWLLELDSGARQDLGRGVTPTWHPDGQRIVLSRVAHDGDRLIAGDLWEVEGSSGRARCLGATTGRIEMEPAVSPDGRHIAFVEGRSGDLFMARYPGPEGE